MRTLQKILARIYPPGWRSRYGDEFDAMLDQTEPRFRNLIDITKGALAMHFGEWSYLRWAIVFAAIGLVAGGLGQFALEDNWQSRVTLKFPSAEKANQARDFLLSRPTMAEVMMRSGIYSGERDHIPLEDVVQHMRRDLRMEQVSSTQFIYAFRYRTRDGAKSTAAYLATHAMDERFGASVTDPPDSLRIPASRYLLVGVTTLCGILLGLFVAACAHRYRRPKSLSH